MPRKKKTEEQTAAETPKKTRTKKKTAPDNEITRLAMIALTGKYGKGRLMVHRLEMNYGKSKTAAIMKEVDTLSKMVVK